ncbi:MAG TPA: hypothetical protein VN515_09945 [Terriglobales bacterium]|nr:hypothetical protein [Terriglobales bacterium]
MAKSLAAGDAAAAQMRAAVVNSLQGAGPSGETVVAALRRSPWMGADLRLMRVTGEGRRIKF